MLREEKRRDSVTQERLRELFELTDDFRFRRIKQQRTQLVGKICGCQRRDGYREVTVDSVCYLEHRLIYLWFHGHMPNEIDHIDGNRANNDIANLREADHGNNMMNMKRPSSNSTGHKGVSFKKKLGKFVAQIATEGKKMHLGYFDTAEAAHAAYCAAAMAVNPEFARFA